MLKWGSGRLWHSASRLSIRTETFMPYVKVAKTSDLNDNSARLVETGGKSIALICADGEYYALDNTCTHVGGPLCEGPVTGGTITCHGMRRNSM
jgi:nitrite reductase/ring-hydroxylating ferredoxin subunit